MGQDVEDKPADLQGRHVSQDTHAFIVRIWHEEDAPQGNITSWRGSIEHVGQGNRLYFYDLEGIVRFIRDQAEIGSRRPLRRWLAALARIRQSLDQLRAKFRARSRP